MKTCFGLPMWRLRPYPVPLVFRVLGGGGVRQLLELTEVVLEALAPRGQRLLLLRIQNPIAPLLGPSVVGNGRVMWHIPASSCYYA